MKRSNIRVFEEAASKLTAALKQDQTGDLTRLAVEALIDMALNDNAVVQSIIKDELCPWCGSLHRSKLHDEFARLIETEEWKKAEMALNYSGDIFSIYKRIPGADLRLLKDPQEY